MLELNRKMNAQLVLILVIFFSCTAALAQETVVSFWSPFTGPDGAVIEAMVEDFNQTAGTDAGVNVELLIVPWSEYYTKLTVAMATETGPNLAISHSERVPAFAAEESLISFAPNVMDDLGIVEDDFVPALWEAGEYEGARYALPIDAFPRHIYYNKTVFENAGLDPESPPTNLAELRAAAEAISASDDSVTPIIFLTCCSFVRRDFLSTYWQFEPNLLNEDGTAVAEGFSEAATKTLEIFSSFIEDGYASATPGDMTALMTQNQVGILFNQITSLLSYSQVEELDFGVAPFPVLGDSPAVYANSHNFVLPVGDNQDDAHLQGALTFIEWFGQNSIDWVAGGKTPATYSVLNSPEFEELSAQVTVAGQMDYMRTPLIIPEMVEIDTFLTETLEAFYGEQFTLEQTVERLERGINDILN